MLVYDRRFKPQAWPVSFLRLAPGCRWSWNDLRVAWPLWEEHTRARAFADVIDPIHPDIVGYCGAGVHEYVGGARGLMYQGTAGDTFTGPNTANANLPTQNASVVIHYKRRDTTNRNSAAFGNGSSTANARAFGCHLPYGDGTIYWDFGGIVSGTTRLTLSAASVTWGDDVWIFTTGPRGMEIWQNGSLKASNGANPTRTNVSTDGWGLFNHFFVKSDNADVGALLMYGRQLEYWEIQRLSIDPWTPFRERRSQPFPAGTGTVGRRPLQVPALIGA